MPPSFLHTLTAFWLDFEGLGPSGGFKKQEKTAPGKSCFFGLKRKVPNLFFMILGSVLGSILELLGDPKWYIKLSVFFLVSGAPPWTILGRLLAPF